jgi:hypothetical protein
MAWGDGGEILIDGNADLVLEEISQHNFSPILVNQDDDSQDGLSHKAVSEEREIGS